jgi:hypothetical protein
MSDPKIDGRRAKKDLPANGKTFANDAIVQIGDLDVSKEVPAEEQPVSKKRDHAQVGDSSTELTEEQEADLFIIEQSRRRVVAVVAARASAPIVPSAVSGEPKRVLASLVPFMVNSIIVGVSIAILNILIVIFITKYMVIKLKQLPCMNNMEIKLKQLPCMNNYYLIEKT